MEILEVIGIEYDYKFKGDDGSWVSGTKLYVACEHEKIVGKKAENMFVKQSVTLPKGLKPGDKVAISFNRYGKVGGVEIVDE